MTSGVSKADVITKVYVVKLVDVVYPGRCRFRYHSCASHLQGEMNGCGDSVGHREWGEDVVVG